MVLISEREGKDGTKKGRAKNNYKTQLMRLHLLQLMYQLELIDIMFCV